MTPRHALHFLITVALWALLGLNTAAVAGPARNSSPPAHRETRCAICHSGGTAPARNLAAVATACETCHRPDSAQLAASSFHDNSRGRCLACHSFHQPDRITMPASSNSSLPATAASAPMCRSCHDPRGNLANLSPAHRTAADLYHSQAAGLKNLSPSQTCLNCHANQSSSDWQDQTDGAVIAFSEHASHPIGVRVVPGAGNSSNWIARNIDPRLPLFDGRIECQTCHLLTAANDDLMIPFPAKYDLCKGCHQHDGDQEPQLVVARVSR